MNEKIDGLEKEIGTRGETKIHSGLRTALRAWVMAKTGRNAQSILHLGTARLGEIYNDTTDKILDALTHEPTTNGNGAQEQPAPITKEEEETPARKEPQGSQSAPEPKRKPEPVKPSGNAMEDRVREIAREEDAAVVELIAAETAARVAAQAVAVSPSLDEERVREIAREERNAVNTIVMTGTPEAPLKIEMGVVHKMFPVLLSALRAGLIPALVGPAGSGKTHAVQSAAKALGLTYELQGTCTTPTAITGYQDANGTYKDTPFYRAFVNGALFAADEFDGWHPNAALALNAGLANGHAAFPDGQPGARAKSDRFGAVMMLNTFGTGASRQYVGRNQMDAATLDRLVFIVWDYDEALERAITVAEAARVGVNEDAALKWLARVQAVRHAVDALKVRHIVSPRASLGGVKLLSVGMERAAIEDMVLFKGMDAEQRARIENAVGGH